MKRKIKPQGLAAVFASGEENSGRKIPKTSLEGAAVFGFLGFRFFVMFQNCPPSLNVLNKPVFIGEMLLGFSTWSLNFFLFCKF